MGRTDSEDMKGSVAEQRDHFVGFAFAAADILLKLDQNYKITYASGAVRELLQAQPGDLLDKNFLKVLSPNERSFFKVVMLGMGPGYRLNPKPISLLQRNGEERRVLMSGFQMENNRGTYYITISDLRRMPKNPHNDEHFDPATRMMKQDNFIDRVRQHIQVDGAMDGEKLTMIVIDGLEKLKAEKGQEAVDDFLQKLSERLRAKSLAGDFVGLLNDGKIGVLHDAEWDDETIMKEAAKLGEEIGQETGQKIKLDAQTIDLSISNITKDDAAKSVAYAIRHFARGSDKLTNTNIHQSATEFLKSTDKRLKEMAKTPLARSFKLALQPVMNLETRIIDHYEALTRFEGYQTPAQMISYSDRKDVLEDFDLLMIQRALDLLVKKDKEEKWQPKISVNISSKSLESDIFTKQISMLLLQYGMLQEMISFEIGDLDRVTDTDRLNKIIQRLRLNENKVYLDRFDIGTNFVKLMQKLQVDGVKIEGSNVHRHLADAKEKSQFQNFCQVADKNKINVIAEAIETEQELIELKKIGVVLGQGDLFGLPTVEVKQKTFAGPTSGNQNSGQSW